MNLKDDLDTLMRTNNHHPVLQEICYKMEQSEEIINGRRRTSSNVISAVILYIANKACQIEHRDTFKKMAHRLNDQTRLSFLNSIVDELRFPNSHSFYFSCIILFIYLEAGKDIIHE
jgi:CCR4-NOT transcription complex subunit 1